MGFGERGRALSEAEVKSRVMAKVAAIKEEKYRYTNPYVLTAEEVEKAGIGECMEMSAVVLKLLRNLGIEAKPLGMYVKYGVESYQHMAVVARINDEVYVIDPKEGVWARGIKEYFEYWKNTYKDLGFTGMKVFTFERVPKEPKKISVRREWKIYSQKEEKKLLLTI
ncbi:MAG: transglutaminase-like domain-containing protein [Candidatus Anstonellales archaeon]